MKFVPCYLEFNKMEFRGYININTIIKIGVSYTPYWTTTAYYEVVLINGSKYYINESDYEKIMNEYLMKGD